jgi:hypothetical protein
VLTPTPETSGLGAKHSAGRDMAEVFGYAAIKRSTLALQLVANTFVTKCADADADADRIYMRIMELSLQHRPLEGRIADVRGGSGFAAVAMQAHQLLTESRWDREHCIDESYRTSIIHLWCLDHNSSI